MHNSDPLSVEVPPGYFWHGQLRHLLMLAVMLPGAWALAEPAIGGDHFFERYRSMPMVREGAFRHSSNAMHTLV